MDTIKDLIQILSIDKYKNLSGKEKELLKLIKMGKDKDYIKEKMFSDSWDKRKSFNNLCQKLKDKLIEKLINISIDKEYKSQEIKLRRDYWIFTVLKLLQKESFFKMSGNLLKRSQNLGLFDVSWKISQVMQLYFLEVKRSPNSAEYYKKIVISSLSNMQIETQIINGYCDLIQGGEFKVDVLPVGYRSGFYYYYAKVIESEQNGNYEGIINACQNGFDFFGSQDYESKFPQRFFLRKTIVPAILSSKNPIELINRNIKLEDNKINLIHLLSYKSIAHLYSQEYYLAIEVVKGALKEATEPYNIQQLKILEAWAHLMVDNDYRTLETIEEIPLFKKNKERDKASLNLLKFFYLVKRKEYDLIIDKLQDALKVYKNRYLRDNERMREVFKLIDIVIRCSFKKEKYSKHIAPIMEKLKELPVENLNIEPIPYDRVIKELL